MTHRALIVDDEALARQRLADLLAEAGDIDLVGSCADGPDAVDRITELRPDLVFLDVQMPEMNGFEVLDAIGLDTIPALIFVTAFDDYALRAFDARAIDYLLKPFTSARFDEALQRARRLLARSEPHHHDGRADDLLADMLPPPAERRIAARDGNRIVFLRARDIDWIEGAGNYVRIHAGERTCTLRSTLRRAAARLHSAGFRRISHSIIINADRVSTLERTTDGAYRLRLDDGTTLNSTRSYADALSDLLRFP